MSSGQTPRHLRRAPRILERPRRPDGALRGLEPLEAALTLVGAGTAFSAWRVGLGVGAAVAQVHDVAGELSRLQQCEPERPLERREERSPGTEDDGAQEQPQLIDQP